MSLQRFQNSSERLIARYGADRTYHRKVGQVYDIDTQTMVSTEETYLVKVFKTEPKERELKYPNLVPRDTAVMLIAAKSLNFKPSVGDLITETYLGTTNTFTVEIVKENWSGNGIVSWRLVCTQS